jgi:hypothetical protein
MQVTVRYYGANATRPKCSVQLWQVMSQLLHSRQFVPIMWAVVSCIIFILLISVSAAVGNGGDFKGVSRFVPVASYSTIGQDAEHDEPVISIYSSWEAADLNNFSVINRVRLLNVDGINIVGGSSNPCNLFDLIAKIHNYSWHSSHILPIQFYVLDTQKFFRRIPILARDILKVEPWPLHIIESIFSYIGLNFSCLSTDARSFVSSQEHDALEYGNDGQHKSETSEHEGIESDRIIPSLNPNFRKRLPDGFGWLVLIAGFIGTTGGISAIFIIFYTWNFIEKWQNNKYPKSKSDQSI